MWHLRGLLVFGTYMAITCFMSHGANGAINDINVFLMLSWWFRGNMWHFVPVLMMVLASVSCATDDGLGFMWYWSQWHNMTKKVMLHIISWPMIYSGSIDDGISITWCQCQWCYMTQKVTLHLIVIIQTQGMQWCPWQWCMHHMMLTTITLSSWNVNADANDITGQKSHVKPHFSHPNLRSNGPIDDAISSKWHWWQCQWHQMTKTCCISF